MEEAASDSFELYERDRNQPISQWVYSVLRVNILRLHLRPGQAVSETEIAARMEVSRTPVREAFIRLGADGLLEVRPQRFSVISRIDLEQSEETRFVRRSLEKSILKEACGCFTESGFSALAENLEAQRSCIPARDFDAFLAADDDFHRIIYKECRKERIWVFIKRLDNSHDRLRIMTVPLIIDELIGEHRAFIDLLSERRLGAVDDLVDSHLTNIIINKVIQEYPREYFKQDPRLYAEPASRS